MNRSIQITAAASETRLQILRMLKHPKKQFGTQVSADPVEFGVCMTLIAEALGLSQPTVSRHLDILKRARFITVKKHQKWSYCRRDEAAIEDYLSWLQDDMGHRK
nr:metalloregulator ArsR/SmtB family transcription factor [Roseobacter sp. H9]